MVEGLASKRSATASYMWSQLKHFFSFFDAHSYVHSEGCKVVAVAEGQFLYNNRGTFSG